MQAHDIALGEQLARVDARGAGFALELGLGRPRRLHQAEAERHRAPPRCLADPAGAEQAEDPTT